MPGLPLSSLTLTAGFHDRLSSQRFASSGAGKPDELRDIFAWHDVRTVSKSLTFQYDKILYLMDTTEENSRLAGEKLKY